MKKYRILAGMLAAALLTLGGCTGKVPPAPTASSAPPVPTSAPTSAATPTPVPTGAPVTPQLTQAPAGEEEVRVLMLKGPTGLGAVKLMDDAAAGAAAQRYVFTVDADPSAVPAKLTSGEVDLAALPTNVAANLYNKTGDIRMLALNTLGVLYILENGNTVQSVADLAGKTISATGQGANPEYVLNFLLEQNGLTPGEDVTIEWLPSDQLTALMASGERDLCMLPVPAATGVRLKNSDVRTALDLTEEWDQCVSDGSVLTMGCVVARREFVEQHPDAVDAFLQEYAQSIQYVLDHPGDAAALAETYAITPNAAVAKAAIPQANLVCVTGRDMPASIQGYYRVLWKANSASIGGSLPDDAFYYVP